MIRGLELVALGKTQSFEIHYENGTYYDHKNKPRDDILDMTCYGCGTSYYMLEEDPIDFCPHCGGFERMRFTNYQEIAMWSRDQNWKYLDRIRLKVFAVSHGDSWDLRFAKAAQDLEMTGRYAAVRELAG